MMGSTLCKPLDAPRRRAILEALRSGKSPRAVARELHHDPRTVRRLAREEGIETRHQRKIDVPAEIARGAAHLLAHSQVSIGELAKGFGLSRATLKRRLHAEGARGYGRHLRPPERERIQELLAAGLKSTEVASQVGRHLRTVERIRAAHLARMGAPAAAELPAAAS
jgi:DNA-binding NarL/FixJ family response regulator